MTNFRKLSPEAQVTLVSRFVNLCNDIEMNEKSSKSEEYSELQCAYLCVPCEQYTSFMRSAPIIALSIVNKDVRFRKTKRKTNSDL